MTILIHGNEQLPKAVFIITENYNYKHVRTPAITGNYPHAIKSQLTISEDGGKAVNLCLNDFFDYHFTVKSRPNRYQHQWFIQSLQASNPAKTSSAIHNFSQLERFQQKHLFNFFGWVGLVNIVRFFKKVEEITFSVRPLNNLRFSEKTKTNVAYIMV